MKERALKRLRRIGERLISGLRELCGRGGLPVLINGVGAVFHLSFTTENRMHDYSDTLRVDTAMAKTASFGLMLDRGVYLLPMCRWYFPPCITEAEVDETLRVAAGGVPANRGRSQSTSCRGI